MENVEKMGNSDSGEEKKIKVKVTVEIPEDKINSFIRFMEGFCEISNCDSPMFERELEKELESYYENSMWDVLIKNKFFTKEELEILDKDDGVPFIEKVITSGKITEVELAMVLSSAYGMEVFDVRNYRAPNEINELIPLYIIKSYKVIPIYKSGTRLTVAISDPTNLETLDSLRYILRMDIEGVVAPYFQLQDAVQNWK